MSLATRCTSCGTAFRVVQDQLKVSEGWVRCGQCNAVFSALEGLFDLGRDAPAEWQQPVEPPAASALPVETPRPAARPPSRRDDDGHGEPEDEPEEPLDIALGDDQGPTSNLGELLADPIDARLFGPRKRAESAPKPAGQLGAADRVEFSDARFDSDLFSENTSVPNAQTLVMPRDEASDLPFEESAGPEFVRRADRRARWESTPVRLALGLGCLLCVIVLGLQGANLHRDTIAARWPSLRPAALAWCRVAQCRIEPPRRLHEVLLDSSTLTRSPGQDGFILSVSLHSRSDLTVALPWFDLSLTDGNGRLVARRALTPRDFRAPEVIEPHAETTLQTLLNTGSATVVGYTVEIFYP